MPEIFDKKFFFLMSERSLESVIAENGISGKTIIKYDEYAKTISAECG